jgi:hypothetical protein
MPKATVVDVWTERGRFYMSAKVSEPDGVTEYTGSVDVAEMAGKTVSEKRDILTAAVKAARDAQQGRKPLIGVVVKGAQVDI